MHSKINANSDIIVSGKRGLIAGSTIEGNQQASTTGTLDRIRGWSGHNFR